MELNSILITLQGTLKNAMKSTGEFTKLKYKGGNEMKIYLIIKEIENFLTENKFIDKRCLNQNYINEVRNITFFLVLNTEFNEDLSPLVKDNAHLINACPTLSKCLLANIVVELDLVKCYCDIIHQLPLHITEELLTEMISCIKKAPIKQSLEYGYLCVKEIIEKLNHANYSEFKDREYCDSLIDIGIEILPVFSNFHSDKFQSWKKMQIFEHMGHSTLKLLILLHFCKIQEEHNLRFISALVYTTTEVLKTVTISVYCVWAETELDGQPLQVLVQEEAYYVKEKYANVQIANELTQFLQTMAKKPKTLLEQIREADVTTIVSQVYKADQNQKKWFTALLNTQVFNDAKAIECLENWSHLCSSDDIIRIMNLGIHVKNPEIKEVIINCFSHIDYEEIIIIMTRFHYEHKFTHNIETKHMKNKLKILLNKFNSGEIDLKKDLLIIFIQNIPFVLMQLYEECIKSNSFANSLQQLFIDTKILVQIDNLATKTLKTLINTVHPNMQNISSYKEFIQIIRNCNIVDSKTILYKIIQPTIRNVYLEKNYEELKCRLLLISDICILDEKTFEVVAMLLEILDGNRCRFFEFVNVQKDVNEEIIKYLNSIITQIYESNESLKENSPLETKHFLNKHYLNSIKQKKKISLYDDLLPNLSIDDYSERVAKFIKILPSCVTMEWIDLITNLSSQKGAFEISDFLTDVLILICQLAVTQEKSNERNFAMAALKYCLQNFGIVMKDIIFPQCSATELEAITKKICQLFREIPNSIKEEECLKLITLFSDETLKHLKSDKQFAITLVAIGNPKVSQLLAKKVLA